MNNTTKAAVLLLAGIATGMTLGLLFAPGRGSDNREKLSASLQNLGDTIIDTAAVSIDSILNFTDNVITQLKAKNDLYASMHDDIENAII
jgi:gas vesicle protein